MTDTQKPETNLQPAAGYTYKAENYCLHHALTNLERNLNHPLFDVHALAAVTGDEEQVLAIAAEHMEIDHLNPYSYDSDVFPKPFTKDQVGPDGYCPISGCAIRFIDGVQLYPFTVTGITMADGRVIPCHLIPGHIGEAIHGCLDLEEDGNDRWTAQVVAETPDEAVAEALNMLPTIPE